MRRMILVLGVVAASCSAPAPRTDLPRMQRAQPALAVAPVVAVPIELPPAPIAHAMKQVCHPAAAGAVSVMSTERSKQYEIAAMPLTPEPFGSRVETQPRDGFVRHAAAIRGAVARQRDRLVECLRAAMGHGLRISIVTDGGGSRVTVRVAMTIDPLGLVTDLEVTGQPSLDACVRESLAAIRVSRRTPRETRVTGSIEFRYLDGVKPLRKRPPAPPLPAVPLVTCMTTLDPTPVDTLDIADLAWIEFPLDGGRGTVCSRPEADRRMARAALKSNVGAYRACYAEALGRDPGMTGEIKVEIPFALTGEPLQVTISGAGDGLLHTCLRDALSAIAVSPAPSDALAVTTWFTLTPVPPTPSDDVDVIAAGHAAIAAAATTAAEGCRARVDLVLAYANATWGIDARVRAAVRSLADFVSQHDRDGRAACVREATPLLVRVARWPLLNPEGPSAWRWRGAGLAEAVDRSRQMIVAFPELERTLLPFIADSLAILDQPEEAMAAYLRFLALGEHAAAEIEWAARGYHQSATEYAEGVDLVPRCETIQVY